MSGLAGYACYETSSLNADSLRQGGHVHIYVRAIYQGLNRLEQALPEEAFYHLARIHAAIDELVAIIDTVSARSDVLLPMPEFSEIYRSKLSQITLRLYQLQRQVCAEHHPALDALQVDVLHLGGLDAAQEASV
jgi:hypothetical protein